MNSEVSIQQLELAMSLKELLQRYGLTTVKSIIDSSVEEIAICLRIETHVVKIIVDEAKRIYIESSIKERELHL
jgi:hypothetical protein